MKQFLCCLAFLSLLFVTSCGQNQKKDYVVTIKTKHGDMVAILYDETPKHKENFIKLAKEHYYDSTLFHRVIQGFMIQGGDPDSKKAQPGQPLGMGGPSYTVEAEINPKFIHEKGALSAARLGDAQNPTRASSGSQFYIVQGKTFTREQLTIDDQMLNNALMKYFENDQNRPVYDSLIAYYNGGDMEGYQNYVYQIRPRVEAATGINVSRDYPEEKVQVYSTVGGAPHLDGGYTVFGKVIKGLEVIDKIAAEPVAPGDRPLQDIRMTVTVTEMSRNKIEKEYGYKYPEVKK